MAGDPHPKPPPRVKAPKPLSAAGLNAHHVALRARGGVHHVANLVTLCVSCHAWVHAHPEQATEEGWLA